MSYESILFKNFCIEPSFRIYAVSLHEKKAHMSLTIVLLTAKKNNAMSSPAANLSKEKICLDHGFFSSIVFGIFGNVISTKNLAAETNTKKLNF